jgi:bisphosphoglycerate-independent phosphoglycerate mutase (AlkP superfamily)
MKLKTKRVGFFVGIRDLAPTLLVFFNINVPEIMQGKDILSMIQGENGGRITV